MSTTSDAAGFFTKLANGDFGLARTCWLYGVVVGIVANVIFRAMGASIIVLLLLLAYTVYEVLVLMGVWRASDKYAGPKIWALLARIAVVLGAISLLSSAFALYG